MRYLYTYGTEAIYIIIISIQYILTRRSRIEKHKKLSAKQQNFAIVFAKGYIGKGLYTQGRITKYTC